MSLPDHIIIDAKGYWWRQWDDQPEFWSMVPVNPDNSPIPYPVSWFCLIPREQADVWEQLVVKWSSLAIEHADKAREAEEVAIDALKRLSRERSLRQRLATLVEEGDYYGFHDGRNNALAESKALDEPLP